MAFSITLSDAEWALVADLFEPPSRRGAPALIDRRSMVDAMLFLGPDGLPVALPARALPAVGAVWQRWRRWRANGVWARAMARLGGLIRFLHGREPLPSMVIIDAQTVKGGRYGPTYHQAGGRGGRTIGAKRTVLVEILGLPVAAHVESARPHDVPAGRELIHEALPRQPRVSDVLGDRAYRALVKAVAKHGVRLVIKAPPAGQRGFRPIAPLYKVEHAFAQLGRWRRLSRCFEGTAASARAWLEVACLGYLFSRL
jgi:putative transposase